jgi:iron complex outermembrane receptor protein
MGTSKYFTTDLRVRFAIDRQWHAAFGIDNLNNYQYWNFHPYPQRTYSAELRYDL